MMPEPADKVPRRLRLEPARGSIIVSCQAYPGDPLNNPAIMCKMAESAILGGATAVRAKGLDDIRAITAAVHVPVIGLVKIGHDGVYITPTLAAALQVADAGADVIALDGTRRDRPDGRTFAETLIEIRKHTSAEVMADCGSLDDALQAQQAGADYLSTTLAGYTHQRPRTTGPDLDLLKQMVTACNIPVIAEGRIHTPDDAQAALTLGAFAVCVGSAITHPGRTTTRFIQATLKCPGCPGQEPS